MDYNAKAREWLESEYPNNNSTSGVTRLSALLREAAEQMRERCAVKAFYLLLNGPGSATAEKHAAAIRALEVE